MLAWQVGGFTVTCDSGASCQISHLSTELINCKIPYLPSTRIITPLIIRHITTLAWRVTHEGLLLFAADSSVIFLVAVLSVLARKNSDDVGADLHQMTFTTTHAKKLIRAADGFVSRLAAALTLRAVALGVVDFTLTSLRCHTSVTSKYARMLVTEV